MMNLYLAQQVTGRFYCTYLDERVTTVRVCLPAHAVVVCLFTVGGLISHEVAGILHRIEGHLDGLQYKHILQNVMVPSVRKLYPDGIINFQQDHSSTYDSCVVQEWLSLQVDVELTDWPRRAPDMNHVQNMWCEAKRTMQEI